jgi:tellurite resistance protein TerC
MMEFLTQPFLGEAVWVWGALLTFVTTVLALDLGVFNKKDHVIEMKESLKLASIYISFGVMFGLWVWYRNGSDMAMDYYTVYILEQTLSLDNLFVMSIIFASFSIPREYQHRLLVYGIIGVVILRGATIAAGAALVQEYSWILLLFAAFLFFTGLKLFFVAGEEEREDFSQKPIARFLAKHLRVTSNLHGKKFFVKVTPENGVGKAVLHATPMFLALVIIEFTDLLFAFDSVPAALAITTNPYIVFTANIFAILGLRAIFFAMEHIIHRFVYLKYSLAILLMFIAGKVFYTQIMDEHIPAALSLGLTVAILGGGIMASLLRTKKNEPVQH